LDENTRRTSVTMYLDSAVPPDAEVLDSVMSRVPPRRPPRGFPRSAVLVAAVAAAILATLGTVFAAGNNFPIHLNLVPFAHQEGSPGSKQPQDAASSNPVGSAGSKQPQDAASSSSVGSAGSKQPQNAASPDPVAKTPTAPTTLTAAETSFGHHVLTPDSSTGAELQTVYFQAAQPVPAGSKPGQTPTLPIVTIRYSYAGTGLTMWETYDPSSAPLTVDAINDGGAKLKTSLGLGPVDIETVRGSEYAVVRTGTGGPVAEMIWKTAAGIVVTVVFDSPLSASLAFAFATSLR
jgi:hypothetical protein